MENLEYEFLEEIRELKSKKDFLKLSSDIGQEFQDMVQGTYGNDIVEVGISMFGYIKDLFTTNIKSGMDAYKIIISGYPNIPHTDLFAPYFDSILTRQLWVKSSEDMKTGDRKIQSLIVNTFFRWYACTYELYRKMLIFNCYCQGISTGHPVNISNYLFKTKDPAKTLQGNPKRANILKHYNASIRHAISHGNIIIIPGSFVVIRMSNNDKTKIVEKIYDTPDEFIDDVTPDIEIMYNSVRFFFFILTNYFYLKYKEAFGKYIDNIFNDRVLIEIVKCVKENPFNV
jgi:hypothetical protein